jgi:hypothetical protein
MRTAVQEKSAEIPKGDLSGTAGPLRVIAASSLLEAIFLR